MKYIRKMAENILKKMFMVLSYIKFSMCFCLIWKAYLFVDENKEENGKFKQKT